MVSIILDCFNISRDNFTGFCYWCLHVGNLSLQKGLPNQVPLSPCFCIETYFLSCFTILRVMKCWNKIESQHSVHRRKWKKHVTMELLSIFLCVVCLSPPFPKDKGNPRTLRFNLTIHGRLSFPSVNISRPLLGKNNEYSLNRCLRSQNSMSQVSYHRQMVESSFPRLAISKGFSIKSNNSKRNHSGRDFQYVFNMSWLGRQLNVMQC